MKIKKWLKRIFAIVFVLLICIATVKIAPIVASGYDMYKTAVTKISVTDKINQLKKQKNYISINKISTEYLNAVVQSEDHRFYKHFGIDFFAILRATGNNIKAGSFVQGGSTITQQLAKNLYFSFDKKLERKVAEMLVAFELERKLSKEQILELYCNVAYFGEGCYGIKQAAKHYYGIEPLELTNKQATALVKTLKSPNNYNPNLLCRLSA